MEDDFTPLEQSSWGGLLGAYGRMNRWIEADLQKQAGLTHIEFEVLLRLSWAPERRLRIQDLAAQSVLTRSGMSRAVERLEKAGFVQREVAQEDKRGAYAVLSDHGYNQIRAALRLHVAFVRTYFLAAFTEEQLQLFGQLWQQLEAYQNQLPPPADG